MLTTEENEINEATINFIECSFCGYNEQKSMSFILFTLGIFLQLIYQQTNALNKRWFIISIKVLHVAAPGCEPQEVLE
jgi:hypothetical protein